MSEDDEDDEPLCFRRRCMPVFDEAGPPSKQPNSASATPPPPEPSGGAAMSHTIAAKEEILAGSFHADPLELSTCTPFSWGAYISSPTRRREVSSPTLLHIFVAIVALGCNPSDRCRAEDASLSDVEEALESGSRGAEPATEPAVWAVTPLPSAGEGDGTIEPPPVDDELAGAAAAGAAAAGAAAAAPASKSTLVVRARAAAAAASRSGQASQPPSHPSFQDAMQAAMDAHQVHRFFP